MCTWGLNLVSLALGLGTLSPRFQCHLFPVTPPLYSVIRFHRFCPHISHTPSFIVAIHAELLVWATLTQMLGSWGPVRPAWCLPSQDHGQGELVALPPRERRAFSLPPPACQTVLGEADSCGSGRRTKLVPKLEAPQEGKSETARGLDPES